MEMEMEKRKRKGEGGASAKRGKAGEDDDGVKGAAVPADEEVDEFFAVLKRIRVALKYFQERNGGRCTARELTATTTFGLKFEKEDFEGVEKVFESSKGNQGPPGLDLNSYPSCDVSDHGD